MSRAFTKEDDAGGEDLVERPLPPGPNYVTPRGLALLTAAGRELAARKARALAESGDLKPDLKPIERDLRYLEARIKAAIVVPPGSGAEIRFGARVTLEDEAGVSRTVQIVGDDEARTDDRALLSWSSPLALAMMGAKAGETITWEGPESTLRYKVTAVGYPA